MVKKIARLGVVRAEESPLSTGQRCRLTAGRGDPTDSATEKDIASRKRGEGETVV